MFQKTFRLNNSSGNSGTQPPSNSISQIRSRDALGNSILWFGSSNGLAKSNNGARSFISFAGNSAFAKEGIFSLAVHGDTIWTSTGYEKDFQDGTVQTGAGYTFSTDNGNSWRFKQQTLDKRKDSIIAYGVNDSIRILPVIVPEQNVTFDLSVAPNGTVWIASWASGLRRLVHYDSTKWERILLPTDNLSKISPDSAYEFYYDPRPHNNIKAFSVLAVNDSTVWCGTAGGINKSTDAHSQYPSWTKYSHQNQASPILGNWVIAIDYQHYDTPTDTVARVWCTNWIAEDNDEQYGISFTENEGFSWTTLLHGIKAFDFAFKDSIAYIATVEGLFRTDDGGSTFQRTSDIRDNFGNIIATRTIYTVEVVGDTIFAGTSDGLVKSIDNDAHPFGQEWEIIRRSEQLGNEKTTYSYPNPFSPELEITRIHYSTYNRNENVTIEFFDFGMNRVRTLVREATRSGFDHDEIWNGRDDENNVVANGVYFYRVKIGNDEPLWGKVLVLR